MRNLITTKLESDLLNWLLAALADNEDFVVKGLSQHGKTLPYIGWYWRVVDFTERISLGDCGAFVGFMENNKWDYAEWAVTDEQDAEIKRLLVKVVDRYQENNDRQRTLQDLYDYIQTCRPQPVDEREVEAFTER